MAAFAATLGVLVLAGGSPAPDGGRADGAVPPRGAPWDADGYAVLAARHLQRARETGDPRAYERAERAVARALALAPEHHAALTERGALRLARHDFRGALRDALRAHRRAPAAVRPYGVLVDSYVELGRYRAAGRALQEMMDRKPDLASYARTSYWRELHGDLRGAAEALRFAVGASGGAPENTAFVLSLLGDLELARGRWDGAVRAYREALARFPGHVPALAGLARLRAARGDLPGAIRSWRAVVDRRPLPEYAIALAEAELAAGRAGAARRDLALARVAQRAEARAGVRADAELALFEADHGDPARAVRLARAAWRAAPSIGSADALGWALTRAGSPAAGLAWGRRALALGTRDASFLFHAGMSARAAGRAGEARRWLRAALRANPRFSPLHAPRARRALAEL